MKDPTWWQWLLVIGLFGAIYLMIGLGKGWLMRAIQMTIFIVVAGSNIPLHWTSNPYLPGLFGLGMAWLLTVFPVMLFTWPIFDRSPSSDPRLRRHLRGDRPKQARRPWGMLLGRSRPAADTSLGSGEQSVDDGAGHGPVKGAGRIASRPQQRLSLRPLSDERPD